MSDLAELSTLERLYMLSEYEQGLLFERKVDTGGSSISQVSQATDVTANINKLHSISICSNLQNHSH